MSARAFSVPGMSLANSFRNGYVWVPGGIPIASAGRRRAQAVNAAPPRKVLRERVDMRRNSITPTPLLLFLLRERFEVLSARKAAAAALYRPFTAGIWRWSPDLLDRQTRRSARALSEVAEPRGSRRTDEDLDLVR